MKTLFLLLGCATLGACKPAPAPGRVATVADLESAIRYGSFERRLAAVRSLQDRGAAARDAVPFLVECLQDEDPALVDAVRSALQAIGPAPKSSLLRLRCALREHAAAVRLGAAEALVGIGPDAAEAAPELIETLGDRDCSVRLASMCALAGIGAGAVPALLEALADHAPGIGRSLIDALGRIVPEGRDALASLGEPVVEEIIALDR